jgi:hypothetical protein
MRMDGMVTAGLVDDVVALVVGSGFSCWHDSRTSRILRDGSNDRSAQDTRTSNISPKGNAGSSFELSESPDLVVVVVVVVLVVVVAIFVVVSTLVVVVVVVVVVSSREVVVVNEVVVGIAVVVVVGALVVVVIVVASVVVVVSS